MLKTFRATKNKTHLIYLRNAYSSDKDDKREKLLRIRAEQKQLYGRVIRDDLTSETATNDKSIGNTSKFNEFDNISSSNDVRVVTSSLSSEYHWLVRSQGESKNITIFKANTPRNSSNETTNKKSSPKSSSSSKTSLKSSSSSNSTNQNQTQTNEVNQNDEHKVQMSQSSVINPKSAIISAKNLLQQFLLSKRNNKSLQPILFDDAALKSIVNYSLVCEKCTTSQTDDLLADNTMRLPSISKVLQATMPDSARFALKKWKAGKIAEPGFDGFKQYERATLDRGKEFHAAIEDFLNHGQTPERSSSVINLWDSIDSSLKKLQPKSVLSEQPLLHADLKYKGIIDNVSLVKDELSAFEWKTSEKSKPRLNSTYDAPVQLCAYLGALNADPRYDLTVKSGYVIVAYTNGASANVFNLSETELRKYWLIWLQRLQEYWIRVSDGTLPDPI